MGQLRVGVDDADGPAGDRDQKRRRKLRKPSAARQQVLNERFEQFLDSIARCIANLHHREHGWKSAKGGYPRAKAGVMRRVSMAVLKATARHTLHGLEIITLQAMHTHTARRAKSEAAKEADFDEHRYDVRAFGCGGHEECEL